MSKLTTREALEALDKELKVGIEAYHTSYIQHDKLFADTDNYENMKEAAHWKGWRDAYIKVEAMVDPIAQALTEPFDPAKHLEGWVKDADVWKRPAPYITYFILRQVHSGDSDDDLWEVLHGGERIFTGHIPTRAFWEALCGALNIKP